MKTGRLFILFILFFFGVGFLFAFNKNYPINPDGFKGFLTGTAQISGNRSDLISFSVPAGGKVSGVVSFRGVVKGGYFFEANILVNILDQNKNLIKQSNAIAMTDWMTTEPVTFEGSIDFGGLPKGRAYIEIHNDNASGLPENNKNILIPIVIE
jgi:hypothetical protein